MKFEDKKTFDKMHEICTKSLPPELFDKWYAIRMYFCGQIFLNGFDDDEEVTKCGG